MTQKPEKWFFKAMLIFKSAWVLLNFHINWAENVPSVVSLMKNVAFFNNNIFFMKKKNQKDLLKIHLFYETVSLKYLWSHFIHKNQQYCLCCFNRNLSLKRCLVFSYFLLSTLFNWKLQPEVLLIFCLSFVQTQPGVAYKSVVY